MLRRQTGKARGRCCRRCRADEWWYRKDEGRWRCVPCRRKSQRAVMQRVRERKGLVVWRSARSRARAAGLPFRLTLEDVVAAWPANGKCPVLGTPIRAQRGKPGDASPTLDRINPAWGYEAGNVVVMSLRANRAKGGMRAAELARIARWMRRQGLD